MPKLTCQKCGTVWSNRDEVGEPTNTEHLKIFGHQIQVGKSKEDSD